ncbi:hypothetical protein [Aquincola tertiaricarbonis]|nr:hypothetical protein [Aquincola tertiaricarbonis]
MDLTKLLRELRLMRDQPNHRFYALWMLVALAMTVPWCFALFF